MADPLNRSAFDKLVAGMDSEERSNMLEKLNQSSVSVVQLLETENQLPEKNVSLHIRFIAESAFYSFFLCRRAAEEHGEDDLFARSDGRSHCHAKWCRKDPPG